MGTGLTHNRHYKVHDDSIVTHNDKATVLFCGHREELLIPRLRFIGDNAKGQKDRTWGIK